MAESWERRDDETDPAYNCFAIYRDLGIRRTHLEAAARYYESEVGSQSGKIRNVERWSATYDWVKRARDYDAHMDREGRKARLEEIQAMNRQHAKLAAGMMTQAALRIVGGKDRYGNTVEPIDPSKLGPHEVAKWFDLAAKLERIARGMPDSISEQQHTGYVAVGGAQDIAKAMLNNEKAAELAMALAAELEEGDNDDEPD